MGAVDHDNEFVLGPALRVLRLMNCGEQRAVHLHRSYVVSRGETFCRVSVGYAVVLRPSNGRTMTRLLAVRRNCPNQARLRELMDMKAVIDCLRGTRAYELLRVQNILSMRHLNACQRIYRLRQPRYRDQMTNRTFVSGPVVDRRAQDCHEHVCTGTSQRVLTFNYRPCGRFKCGHVTQVCVKDLTVGSCQTMLRLVRNDDDGNG